MKNLRIDKLLKMFFLYVIVVSLSSCDRKIEEGTSVIHKPISKSEIIAFQKAYGISFNAISQAIENESYYETAAKNHIDKNYYLSEGKVMFKIGHDDLDPYRYNYEGILSYLIGKNKEYPNDRGIAKDNWRKMEWKNDGIINNEDGFAVAMGKVRMIKDDDEIIQNYTMCFKRDKSGEIKIITHKIAKPCN